MITAQDILFAASRQGLALDWQCVKDALAAIDRDSLTQEERQRWGYRVWDGNGDPPHGERRRWLQLTDQQLAQWDRMTLKERQAWLPRAELLMRKRNQGRLTPEEEAEVERMPVPHDAIGLATLEANAHGKAIYFLHKDGKLHHYQPFRAYDRGRTLLEMEDAAHPHHWQRAAEDHLAVEVEQAVDQQVLQLALEKALDLHQERGIPLQVAPAVERR